MSTIINVLVNMFVGSVCLVYGVKMISSGLEKINLNRIKHVLTRFTGNVLSSFFVGTIITAIVQSSTAVSIITVGLVNAGTLQFSQALGIIYGTNLGTTITAQFMSFNIMEFYPVFISVGIIFWLVGKRYSVKNIGKALVGFGIMLLGITILNWSMPYIEKSFFLKNMFMRYGKNPYLGMVIGMLVTMLIHSSSATVGFTIVLFNSGLIGFYAAVGIMLGDNIGTCFTSLLAGIGTKVNARRTAWAHTLYNIIGSLITLVLLVPFSLLVIKFTFLLGQDKSRLVANAHTLFNVLSALAFMPFTRHFERFIKWIIR